MSRATFATIDTAAIARNLDRVRALTPHSKIMAVVKAEGYGHGLERAALAMPQADAFGVATLSDAERLRAVGIQQRIVLLEGFDEPDDLIVIDQLDLDFVLHDESQLAPLARFKPTRRLRIWLKVDSGMHRLGFAPDQAKDVLKTLQMRDCEIVLMTHFANAEGGAEPSVAQQTAQFFDRFGDFDGPLSLSNSAAILHHANAHRSWVRAGGILYGLSTEAGKTGADLGFEPAMRLSARLIALKTVPRGERVGYGGSFLCQRDTRLGVVAIGYGDGYPRHAPSGTPVLIRGKRAQLAGRVSMDMLTIDLTDHPSAQVNDEVTLWGAALPVEEIASAAGTISYELTCGMTRRMEYR
jgi:alanine racemase